VLLLAEQCVGVLGAGAGESETKKPPPAHSKTQCEAMRLVWRAGHLQFAAKWQNAPPYNKE
jgi:hypothetical protein